MPKTGLPTAIITGASSGVGLYTRSLSIDHDASFGKPGAAVA